MLRRRSQPDESNRRMNLAVASKFIDGVKNDELRTMLATDYTPLSTNEPTPDVGSIGEQNEQMSIRMSE